VLGDLTAAGLDCDESIVMDAMRNKEIEARRQIIEATNIWCRWLHPRSNG